MHTTGSSLVGPLRKPLLPILPRIVASKLFVIMVVVMMVLVRRDEKLRDDVEGSITSRHVNNLHKLAVDLDSCCDGP